MPNLARDDGPTRPAKLSPFSALTEAFLLPLATNLQIPLEYLSVLMKLDVALGTALIGS